MALQDYINRAKYMDKSKAAMGIAGGIGAAGLGAEIAANKIKKSVIDPEDVTSSMSNFGGNVSLGAAATLAGIMAYRHNKKKKALQSNLGDFSGESLT